MRSRTRGTRPKVAEPPAGRTRTFRTLDGGEIAYTELAPGELQPVGLHELEPATATFEEPDAD